jgi:hypothetical protein
VNFLKPGAGENRIFATPATPADYYSETRTYLSLNKTISRVAETAGRIPCRPILGGLHQKTRHVERWAPGRRSRICYRFAIAKMIA